METGAPCLRLRRLLRLAVLALPAVAAHGQGGGGSPVPEGWTTPPSWVEEVEPFAVADDVYYVGTRDLSSFLFTTGQGHVLLDAPLEENVEAVLRSIRGLGFDPDDVRYLIASHGHFDHTGGLAAMRAATGAEIVLSVEDAELVAAGGAGDFFLQDEATYPPATAHRRVADGARLRLGPLELVANVTAGHTRGCTSWSADVRSGGAPARLVVSCSLSVLDGYRLAGEESYPGIGRDFCRSVETLRGLGADVFLVSHASFFGAHAKAGRGDVRAFVDPVGLHRYLDSALSSIETVLRRQGVADGCGGLSTSP